MTRLWFGVAMLFLVSACGESAADGNAQVSEVSTNAIPEVGVLPEIEATSSIEEPDSIVPAKASADDTRTPVERFIGVPVNHVEAAKWSSDLMEAGIEECMNRHGFQYLPSVPGEDVNPNLAYLEGLSSEENRIFMSYRYGLPEVPAGGTCQDEAAGRVYVLNAFAKEYEIYDTAILTDNRFVAAQRAVNDCLGVQVGAEPEISESVLDECEQKANWAETRDEVVERVQTDFVAAHADELEAFILARPVPK